MRTAICTATERGKELGSRIKAGLGFGELRGVGDSVFDDYDAIVYVCAVGIAVRKIAPFVNSKLTDPAVVVCDEAGKWAISLLSGHIGGANTLAERVAGLIGATAVITTATEALGLADSPRNVALGIGCRKGASAEQIERAATIALYKNGVSMKRVRGIATIDIKREESGLLRFAELYSLPLSFYSAAELNAAQGDFTASEFVSKITGADNVCERAAALLGGAGKLIVKKTAVDGVTVAAFEVGA